MAGYIDGFCKFMDLDSISVHKHAKKELGQYRAILTSHLVNNRYIQQADWGCLSTQTGLHVDTNLAK